MSANIMFVEKLVNPFFDYIDNSTTYRGDGTEGEVIDECIFGNMNDRLRRNIKYFYPYYGIGAIETSTISDYNNDEQTYDYHRLMLGEKAISRILGHYDCDFVVLEYFLNPQGNYGATHLWGYEPGVFTGDEAKYHFCKQMVDENAWMSLAYGFHPDAKHLICRECPAASQQIWETSTNYHEYDDEYVENYVRGDYNAQEVGFRDLFEALNEVGWSPITNVKILDSQITGEDITNEMVVERYGGDKISETAWEPTYISVLNNKLLTPTVTDMHDYGSLKPINLKDMNEDRISAATCLEEFEMDVFVRYNYDEWNAIFDAEDKNIIVQLNNIQHFGLNHEWGNLHGKQLIQHDPIVDGFGNRVVVNDPQIYSGVISMLASPMSENYYVRRLIAGPGDPEITKLAIQWNDHGTIEPIILENKALMVFRLENYEWEDNGGVGSERVEYGGQGNPYFSVYGAWRKAFSDDACLGDYLYISDTNLDSYCEYVFFTNISGQYELKMKIPRLDNLSNRVLVQIIPVIYSDRYYESEAIAQIELDMSGTYVEDMEGYYEVGSFTLDQSTSEQIDHIIVRIKSNRSSEDIVSGDKYLVVDSFKLEKVI